MKGLVMKATSIGLGIVLLMTMLPCCDPVSGQVIPDGSVNTRVSQSGDLFTITDGNRVGDNLFHSFSQFSVPSNGTAFFNNASDVQNIFSRVTGASVSLIDGLIQANGSANLFLLNPKGIIFGANAQLNIGGSFISTTANSIEFADGIEFSSINSQPAPLLSINVPVGLQLGNNPAPINLQGTGHTLTNTSGLTLAPLIRTPHPTKLQVPSGKTIALVGGDINLNGATLIAETGGLELGSVSSPGLVNLIPSAQGYTLGYSNIQHFGNIQLAERSLLDISGVNAGSVQIRGGQLRFTDGSLILSQNFGARPGGEIRLQATESIKLIGRTSDGEIRSGVRSEALGIGSSSNINIITSNLIVNRGAGLTNSTIGSASSGNINIEATATYISGFSATNSAEVTTINTSTLGNGNAGDLFFNGDSLLISDGASLSSTTFGNGSSGKVTIRNTNTTVIGESPSELYSNISSTTFATGNAQTLTLDTKNLQILDGGAVATTAFFVGSGGDLSINASESITISGQGRTISSSINASTLRPDPFLRQRFGLPDILTANPGSVSITTPKLILTNGGTVGVTNQGSGNGGNMSIATNTIQLKNQGFIQAQTKFGNGGNIQLSATDLLLLRQNSLITSTAGGSGNGGNININAPIITALENSDIIANAIRGQGGNIQITTQGMFGLKFRDQITPESDITASSQFGLSGTVQVNTAGVDPNSGLVELPANVTDPSQKIATGCSNNQGSSFIAIGRGGIPQNPTQEIRSDRSWSDTRDISAYRETQTVQAQIPQPPETLVQATSWQRNPQGKIELVVAKSPPQMPPALTCAAVVGN